MITLKEQLEQEKKAASDVKSLKTQQICTLTFKLANAVRQRELAEEELAKVKREMEELKEVMEVQAEEMRAKEGKDESDGHGKQEEDVPQKPDAEEWDEVNKREKKDKDDTFPEKVKREMEELKEEMKVQAEEMSAKEGEDESDGHGKREEDVPREYEADELDEVNRREMKAKDDAIVLSFPEKEEKHLVNDFVENGEGSLPLENKCDELPNENSLHKNLPTEALRQDIPSVVVSSESLSSKLSDEDSMKENSSIRSEREDAVFPLEALPQSSSSGMSDPNQENPEEKGKTADLNKKHKVNEFLENGEGSLPLENKCDALPNENSLHKNLPTEELRQDVARVVVSSQSSSSELSDEHFTKENSSIRSESEDAVFHLEALPQSSSSEMPDPNQESPEEKGKTADLNEKHLVNEFVENGEGSLPSENKCDELPNENSLHKNLMAEEFRQDIPRVVVSSESLSSELNDEDSTKENSSIRSKSEGVFHLEALPQSSSSGMSDPNQENPEEKAKTADLNTEFKKIQEDLCEIQESAIIVSNMSYDVTEDMQNATEQQEKIIETPNLSSARKNRRIRLQNSEEDQTTSPPTSSEAVSSVYTSNNIDEKLVTLLMNHGMDDDHDTVLNSGKDDEEQRVHLEDFFKGNGEVENATREPGTVQERKTLEGFLKKEPVPRAVETENSKSLNKTTAENGVVRKGSEQHNEFMSQTVSEEVEDLKQQLKNAMQKIEELRLENKEMKKEIHNLSSSTAEEAFLVKTTKFTDRLLREMKEREAKVQVPQRQSVTENYGLEREYSYPGLTELSQMGVAGDVRRKTSMPLRIIGAKLKEITRSVENMAMDPDLCEETFTNVCPPDFVDYKSRYLNDHFELEDSLINPSESSKTLSAQSAPFKHDNPGEIQRGCYTSVEKLGEESFLPQTKPQQQFTAEKDCSWKENGFKLTDGPTQERCFYESPSSRWKLHNDTQDYVQRYVVRSSAHIAKMRDLTPEELAFYSKLSYK